MKKLKKLFALLLAVSMIAGTMGGCGSKSKENDKSPGNASGDSRYGGHLNVRIAVQPTGLDPSNQTGVWKYLFTTCVYDPILTRDADNNIKPSVCDFELSEDQLDLKLWVRDGYVFSNGDPVDIYDIEASFNRGLNMYASITNYVKPYVKSAQVEEEDGKQIFHVVFSEYREKCLYYLAAYRTWWAVMPKEICEKYATSYNIDNIEDAIGTGPYVFSDFQASVQVTLSKRADYVPVENDGTGFAATKYGYMDSITFWYNGTDSSTGLALLSGEYDMVEVVPAEYKDMAEQQGITRTVLPSDQRVVIFFNTSGTDNLCAKYPSLRKAIMAAIDYEDFLNVVTDGGMTFEGEHSNFIIGDTYKTDAFKSKDYYGSADQAVVDKYLAMAKEEGYKGEPVQICYNNNRTDIPTLLCDAMDSYGINYKLTTMETAAYTAFVGDPSNNWDFKLNWTTSAVTPTLLQDSIMVNDFKSDVKDRLLAEMYKMDPTSDEYMAKWEELSEHIAEGCYFGYMSAIEWWWWHPETLNIGEEGVARYVYNNYWSDPENHPKKQ